MPAATVKAIGYLKRHAPDWLDRLAVRRADGTIEHRFWQAGGGYDRNLIGPAQCLAFAEYVHGNPLKRGLVERPEEWAWSSAGWYRDRRPGPIRVDATMTSAGGVSDGTRGTRHG